MLLRVLFAALTPCAGLLAQFTPLGQPYVPVENPLTPEKVMLGKILFWDEQLSSDDSVACGTCHLPEFGGSDGRLDRGMHPGPDGLYGTSDDIRASAGIVRQATNGDFKPSPTFGLKTQVTPRTSPTTLAAAYHLELFWDGRASSQFDDPETGFMLIPFGGALESQAVGPILSAIEMGREGRTWNDVRSKLQQATPLRLASAIPADMQAALQQNPSYPALFTMAFGDPAITAARIAYAIASYERVLIPDDTPWDRFVAGQTSAMNQVEKTGWQLFQSIGRCGACHTDPLFSDDLYHNLGLRFAVEDVGRGAISPVPEDYAAFKTPTLRNAGLRPRLFHNGQSPALGDPAQWTDPNSLQNVYFVGGGVDTSNLDPFMLPLNQLGVTQNDVATILEFVRTGLTDQRAALRLPPFDHPDLRSAVVAPPRVFGPDFASGAAPFLIDTVPSYPGNFDFKLGLVGGDAGNLGIVTYGYASFEPALSFSGLPWHLDAFALLPFVFGGQTGQVGHSTWNLPIPNDPTLGTVPFYFQLLAIDALSPVGLASSKGYEFFVR
jgi:cytochrome c peroxidase